MVSVRSMLRAAEHVVIVCILVLAAGCGRMSPTGFRGDVELLLSRGDRYVENLTLKRTDQLTDSEVLALGYVERVRLGLGSPFRTIEYALKDPGIPEGLREPLAYGLLSRTLAGQTYQIDPTVLEIVRLRGISDGQRAAAEQLRLIERTIDLAPTPAAGERTVRLGYLLAASERTVDSGYSAVVANVAALLGDRRRAREDAVQLLRSATRFRSDPLELLVEWRRSATFQVERPALANTSMSEEIAEATDGPALALGLRTIAQRLSGPASLVNAGGGPPPSGDWRTHLDSLAATRLAELAEARNLPPQAPVAVAVAINRPGLVDRPGLSEADRAARQRFVDHTWNEERLVARAALLHWEGAAEGQRPAVVLLQAATFMRVWNQEEPWFPGDPAPTEREIEARFGLANIEFQEDLPESWRAYHRRHLARALADLQSVLPKLTLRGLTIRIAELPNGMDALALHEPRNRTLYLPPKTGAGTLAHELAHDLDSQIARERYLIRGGYATDLAMKGKRGDVIAVAMMELSASLVARNVENTQSAHATRPAEVFARGTDWLVSTLLGREGRLGGYLTSFQDPILTGYGTTRGPDISGAAVPALLSIMESVAPVDSLTREWALDRYGPRRSLTAFELAATVAEAGSHLPPAQRLPVIEQIGLRSVSALSECRYGSADAYRRLVDAQRELTNVSMSAAARGAAIDAVLALAVAQAGPESRPLVEDWLAWRLYGAPEPVDPLLDELAPAFEDLLATPTPAQGLPLAPGLRGAFQSATEPGICGGNPFAADMSVGRFRRVSEAAIR